MNYGCSKALIQSSGADPEGVVWGGGAHTLVGGGAHSDVGCISSIC